jgi:4a-hydroxytetrahydrobiopterin dehydratase
VIIVDKGDVIRYVQIAPELTQPLDYEDVLKNLEIVKKNPNLTIKEDLILKCLPCEGKTPPLPKDSIERLIAECHTWELVDDKKIVKEFEFSNFAEAKYFLDLVSVIAEEQGHHPTMTIIYNHLKITLTTHASGGLTENDFIMAKIIDDLRLE